MSENMDDPGMVASGTLEFQTAINKAAEALKLAFTNMPDEIAEYVAEICVINAAPSLFSAIPGLQVEFAAVGDVSGFPLVDGHPNKDYHPEPPC